MKRLILLLLLYGMPVFLISQANSNVYYWIKFKDKGNSGYSLQNPSEFLSQSSIARRTNQGIVLDSTDLPISQAYSDSISPYITWLRLRLKWFNMIVVEILDSTNVDSIKQFSFVDSIAPIATYPYPYKSLELINKYEELIAPVNQEIIYPDVHGAAYHQINMLNGDLLYQLGFEGQGIIIAMMDNGWLYTDTISAFDSVRPRILNTWDFVHNRANVYADPLSGHATITLSCIAANIPYKFVGAGPEASFCLYQTQDNDTEWILEEYYWAESAEMADSAGAQIFSTSLGYTLFYDDIGDHTYADLNGNKTVITQASNIATSKGIIVFNAAGNDGGPGDMWHYISAPADADSIVTVGSVDSLGVISSFSSFGPNSSGRIKPDLCAQGSFPYFIDPYNRGVIAYGTGTSLSCPILAGCTASLWSAFPDKTAKEIQSAILLSADHFWIPDNHRGYGVPNFYNAYLFLKTGFNGNVLRISDDVTVYPNPFSSQLNISLYDSVGGNHTIELFDLIGKKVLSQEFTIRKNTFEILTINQTVPLAAGEYILKYDGQSQYTHEVIKVK